MNFTMDHMHENHVCVCLFGNNNTLFTIFLFYFFLPEKKLPKTLILNSVCCFVELCWSKDHKKKNLLINWMLFLISFLLFCLQINCSCISFSTSFPPSLSSTSIAIAISISFSLFHHLGNTEWLVVLWSPLLPPPKSIVFLINRKKNRRNDYRKREEFWPIYIQWLLIVGNEYRTNVLYKIRSNEIFGDRFWSNCGIWLQ